MTQNLQALETLKRTILDCLPDVRREEYIYARTVTLSTGIPQDVATALLRLMRSTGLAEYRRGLLGDSGEVAGRGYARTEAGTEYLRAEVPAGALVWAAVTPGCCDVEAAGIGGSYVISVDSVFAGGGHSVFYPNNSCRVPDCIEPTMPEAQSACQSHHDLTVTA